MLQTKTHTIQQKNAFRLQSSETKAGNITKARSGEFDSTRVDYRSQATLGPTGRDERAPLTEVDALPNEKCSKPALLHLYASPITSRSTMTTSGRKCRSLPL